MRIIVVRLSPGVCNIWFSQCNITFLRCPLSTIIHIIHARLEEQRGSPAVPIVNTLKSANNIYFRERNYKFTSNADLWLVSDGGPTWNMDLVGFVSFSSTLFISLTVSPREKYSSSTSLAVLTRSRLAPVILQS